MNSGAGFLAVWRHVGSGRGSTARVTKRQDLGWSRFGFGSWFNGVVAGGAGLHEHGFGREKMKIGEEKERGGRKITKKPLIFSHVPITCRFPSKILTEVTNL